MNILINTTELEQMFQEDMDAFLETILNAIKKETGENLDATSMQRLNASQITLWGYSILHDELMDGGFIQLIYNGYGPFFFDNPFAKAMRLWGLKDLSKLIYKAKELYDQDKYELTKPRSDEDFMALFEQYPQFDELDDVFVEDEEDFTEQIALFVHDHLSDFLEIAEVPETR